jgi:Flp pilus assembly CpaF family ATPase
MTQTLSPSAVPVLDGVVRTVHGRVASRLAALGEDVPRTEREAHGRALIREELDAHTRSALASGGAVLDAGAEERVAASVFAILFGLGALQPLLDDPGIENIVVNGADTVFVTYAGGRRETRAPIAASDEDLVDQIRMIASRLGVQERRFDRASPALNLQLPDGSRLFAVMEVSGRPSLSIRRHRFTKVTLTDLVRLGSVDEALRALADAIPSCERLITIEDTYELALDRDPAAHPDVVPLQAREANIEGAGEITQAELVRWALRMSPDRVIVGECRGIETVPMLNAMSQGNDGSMATLHASSSHGAFGKLAAYAAQAPERLDVPTVNLLIANAIDVVVHLRRTGDGTRVISSVREVVGADGHQIISNEVYTPGRDARATPGSPWSSESVERLIDAGLDPQDAAHARGWAA